MNSFSKIEILDSTLREGEQTPGVSFTIKQKVTIAKLLDDFGVDFIELGHPAVSPDVYAAVETLNDLDLKVKKNDIFNLRDKQTSGKTRYRNKTLSGMEEESQRKANPH